MRARDCVWRQTIDADRCQWIQLTRKLARYWVNSVQQEQVRRGRGPNRNIPSRGASASAKCASPKSGLNRNAESMADFARAKRAGVRYPLP